MFYSSSQTINWFYDDSGYYTYILFDGSPDVFQDIENILYQIGVQILLSGRSYRPAGNGRQYDWYIRVDARTAPYNVIGNLFSQLSFENRPVELVDENYPPPFFLTTEALETELEEAKNTLRQKQEEINELKSFKDKYQILVNRHKTLARAAKSAIEKKGELEFALYDLQRKLHQNSLDLDELKQFKKKYEELRKKISALQEQNQSLQHQLSSSLENGLDKSNQLVVANKKLQNELRQKEEELNKWISDYDTELEKRKSEIDQWVSEVESKDRQLISLKNENYMLAQEKAQLLDHLHENNKITVSSKDKSSAEPLFQYILALFAPNIEFLAGSLQILWQEMATPERILKDLSRLHRVKGKRVESVDGWLERTYNEWRLYYQPCGDKNYKVLISAKKTQQHDIEWLKKFR